MTFSVKFCASVVLRAQAVIVKVDVDSERKREYKKSTPPRVQVNKVVVVVDTTSRARAPNRKMYQKSKAKMASMFLSKHLTEL